MIQEERQQRLREVADLLTTLKACGCPQRLIGAFLRVSHASLSHWRRACEDPTRKVGVPSDEQLARLIALCQYQLGESLNRMHGFCDTAGPARRSSALMYYAIGALLKNHTRYHELRGQRREQFVAKTRQVIELLGVEDAKLMLNPVTFSRLGDESDPTEAEWAAAHERREVEAEETLKAYAVTEADMDRARQDLRDWVARQQARLKAKVLAELEPRQQAAAGQTPATPKPRVRKSSAKRTK